MQQTEGIKLTEAERSGFQGGTVVCMAGAASLSSRSLGQNPILTPCDGNSYWTCQTPATHLAVLEWEIDGNCIEAKLRTWFW